MPFALTSLSFSHPSIRETMTMPSRLSVTLLLSIVCLVLSVNEVVASFASISRPLQHVRTPSHRQHQLRIPLHQLGLFGFKNPVQKASHEHKDKDDDNHATAGQPRITTVHKLDDYLDFLKEDDRLCIVKFHAAWCKSCQKFGVKYRQLAMKHGDLYSKENQLIHSGKVRFAEVEYGTNTKLCRGLGIKRLPSVFIYKAPIGKVSGFSCGPKKFPLLVEKLQHFLECSDAELQFEADMEQGSALADSLLPDLTAGATMSEEVTSKNQTNLAAP